MLTKVKGQLVSLRASAIRSHKEADIRKPGSLRAFLILGIHRISLSLLRNTFSNCMRVPRRASLPRRSFASSDHRCFAHSLRGIPHRRATLPFGIVARHRNIYCSNRDASSLDATRFHRHPSCESTPILLRSVLLARVQFGM